MAERRTLRGDMMNFGDMARISKGWFNNHIMRDYTDVIVLRSLERPEEYPLAFHLPNPRNISQRVYDYKAAFGPVGDLHCLAVILLTLQSYSLQHAERILIPNPLTPGHWSAEIIDLKRAWLAVYDLLCEDRVDWAKITKVRVSSQDVRYISAGDRSRLHMFVDSEVRFLSSLQPRCHGSDTQRGLFSSVLAQLIPQEHWSFPRKWLRLRTPGFARSRITGSRSVELCFGSRRQQYLALNGRE